MLCIDHLAALCFTHTTLIKMPCVSHAHRYTAGLVDSDTGKLTPAGPLTLPPATDGCTWSLGEPGQQRACFMRKIAYSFTQLTNACSGMCANLCACSAVYALYNWMYVVSGRATWVRSVFQITCPPNTRACSGMCASLHLPFLCPFMVPIARHLQQCLSCEPLSQARLDASTQGLLARRRRRLLRILRGSCLPKKRAAQQSSASLSSVLSASIHQVLPPT